ncbi:MAG: sulfotransferase [Polaribacter sp.]|nr:sulfotransferase [Polaribacter sp.]
MSKIIPNFLLVGAPKAGTTSIANYLNEHPDIFISEEKEPFYFLPNILTDTNKKDPMYDSIKRRAHLSDTEYYGLFSNAKSEKKIGEATVHYLYHFNEVIPRVKKELGDIDIIIVLRNPIARAFSNYKYQNKGQIVSFEKALKLEEHRRENNYNSFWFYKEVGKYYAPVKEYLSSFSRVHICFFEDFKENPINFMQNMYSFLLVNNEFEPNISIKHNPTMVPKNKILHFLFYFKNRYVIKNIFPKRIRHFLQNQFFKKNNTKLTTETSDRLKDYFKPDIKELEQLLNSDLSKWYS